MSTAAGQRSTHPMLTVDLRSELLAPRGVPPDGSEGNFKAFPSSRGFSHAPTSLASSTPLLSFVTAFVFDFPYYPRLYLSVNIKSSTRTTRFRPHLRNGMLQLWKRASIKTVASEITHRAQSPICCRFCPLMISEQVLQGPSNVVCDGRTVRRKQQFTVQIGEASDRVARCIRILRGEWEGR